MISDSQWQQTFLEHVDERNRFAALKSNKWNYDSTNRIGCPSLASHPCESAITVAVGENHKDIGAIPFNEWCDLRTIFDAFCEPTVTDDKEKIRQLCFGALHGPEIYTVDYGGQPTGKVRRRFDNCLGICGIGIDFDGGTCSISEVVERLNALDLEAIVYTTYSHTNNCPRFRVLLAFATPYPTKSIPEWRRFRLYYEAVLRLLGIEKDVDLAAKDPLRWHRLCCHAPGAPFHSEYVDGNPLNWTKLEIVEDVRPSREPSRDTDVGDPELVEALNKIDPSCDYFTWRNVVFAFKSEFGETENDEAALHLLDDWSARSVEKYDSDQLAAIWEFASTDGGINLGTFWWIANSYGHDRDAYAARVLQQFYARTKGLQS